MSLTAEQKAHLGEEAAKVCHLPSQSGDGYAYGGGCILTVGPYAFVVGEGNVATALAELLADRWNAGRRALAEAEGK